MESFEKEKILENLNKIDEFLIKLNSNLRIAQKYNLQ